MSECSNIQALIHLIDDPDDLIYAQVRDRLMQYGPDAIPFLESSWTAYDYGQLYLERIEQVIQDIQFKEICQQLKDWKKGDRDLLEGALIIAKYQYPGIDIDSIYEFFERLRKEIWLEIGNKFTALEKVRVINKVLFNSYQFKGDKKNFHSPLNSYLNTVIELKRGNPLSLGIIYSIIAQKLDLPIYGVNLPNHFVLAYLDEENIHQYSGIENHYGVLFYINVFSNGGIFDHAEVEDYLKRIQVEPSKLYFEPCSNTAILTRMLTNLISSYSKINKLEKVQELTLLRKIIC